MTVDELYQYLRDDLYGRVNILTRQTSEGQMVVIYEDHRWILNVLFALNKYIPRPDLIFFDAHDDAAPCLKKSDLLKQIGVEDLTSATPRQFGTFVDYELGTDDGNWLTAAMELNLISDVVNIGNRHNDNIQHMNGIYTDEEGIVHNVFELSGYIDYELDRTGKLGDKSKENEYRKLRDFFGIQHSYSAFRGVEIKRPFVLDFDLDFFTIDSDDYLVHGWTEKLLEKRCPACGLQNSFIRRLINDAQIITICREPDCCGSIGDSNRILELLDGHYFESQLGTEVTL